MRQGVVAKCDRYTLLYTEYYRVYYRERERTLKKTLTKFFQCGKIKKRTVLTAIRTAQKKFLNASKHSKIILWYYYYTIECLACQGGNYSMEKLNQNTSWYRTPTQMAEDDRLKPADVLVYSALLDFCTDSLTCTVGRSELLPRLRCMSKDTLLRSIDRLERCGYLERVKTAGEKNTYKLADIIGLKRQRRTITQSRRTEEPEQETKQRYGKYQNVLLTVAEFDRLTAEYGTKANSYIQQCDSYCQSTGRRYADYNATIRRWIDSDIEKNLLKDEIKRQEFSEIDEYLQLVNQFDD